MIQYRPFCLTIWTPFIVALSIPLSKGTNVRSARRLAIRQVFSLVISTSASHSAGYPDFFNCRMVFAAVRHELVFVVSSLFVSYPVPSRRLQHPAYVAAACALLPRMAIGTQKLQVLEPVV